MLGTTRCLESSVLLSMRLFQSSRSRVLREKVGGRAKHGDQAEADRALTEKAPHGQRRGPGDLRPSPQHSEDEAWGSLGLSCLTLHLIT